MFIESVMPSNHLILCCPPLLLTSILPSIRVFSNESVLHIRWPKYWSFNFNISPSNEHSGLISFRIDWFDLSAVQRTLKSLLQYHSSKASILWCSAFFIVQLSHPYMTPGKTVAFTRRTFVGKVMSLLFNMLSRLVITFLPRSKRSIGWSQKEKWNQPLPRIDFSYPGPFLNSCPFNPSKRGYWYSKHWEFSYEFSSGGVRWSLWFSPGEFQGFICVWGIQASIPVTLPAVGEDRITELGPSHVAVKVGLSSGIAFTNTKPPWLCKDFLFSFGCEIPFSKDGNYFWKEVSDTCLCRWFLGLEVNHFLRNGLPYNISKGLSPSDCGVFLILTRSKGSKEVQEMWVSCESFHKCLLIILLAFSAFPEDWGLQAQCKWNSILRAWEMPCAIVALKAGPLSLWTPCGRPKRRMISYLKVLTTSFACSILQRKASIHPVKVSTQSSRYWCPLAFDIWVKSIQSSPGYLTVRCKPGRADWLLTGVILLTDFTPFSNLAYSFY